MSRPAPLIAALLAAAVLVVGCGGGSGGGSSSTAPAGGPPKASAPGAPAGSKVTACGGRAQLRATEVDCAAAEATMKQWEASGACALAAGESRGSCALGSFRCQAVQAGEGVAVSCVGGEGDVAFIVRRAG